MQEIRRTLDEKSFEAEESSYAIQQQLPLEFFFSLKNVSLNLKGK